MNGQSSDHFSRERRAAAEGCACFKLRKASRAVTRLYEHFLQPCDLKATQFSLLVTLSTAGPITIARLADRMELERTTLTRNLRPLERQGLLEIIPGEDRRTRVAVLTKTGRQILSRALPLWKEAQTEIVSRLGQQRWDDLRELLDTTVEVARLSSSFGTAERSTWRK